MYLKMDMARLVKSVLVERLDASLACLELNWSPAVSHIPHGLKPDYVITPIK